MSKARTSRSLIALIGIAFCSASLHAETMYEKAKRDKIVKVAKDDPVMLEAMRKARSTLSQFLALAKTPPPKTKVFSVKVAVHDGGRVEYFWITPFESKDGKFSGKLDNRPETVSNVTIGQIITFAETEIVDWMYMEDGKMRGGYTTCAILKKAPQAEAQELVKHYGLACDF